jgi:transposase
MDRAPLPDLDRLDRDALLALIRARQDELTAQQDDLRSLQSELDSHRQIISEQAYELNARGQRIEHMKLMIEKLRQMMFGKKSEKVILKLEQLEFELEEEETTQAVTEAVLDRVSPAREAKARPERKPFRNILSVKSSRTFPDAIAVQIAELSCGSLARMSPNNWSTFRTASRSSVM